MKKTAKRTLALALSLILLLALLPVGVLAAGLTKASISNCTLSDSTVALGEDFYVRGTVDAGDYYLRRIAVSIFNSADCSHGFEYDAIEFDYSEKKTSCSLQTSALDYISLDETFTCTGCTPSHTCTFDGTAYVVVYVGVYNRSTGENDYNGGCASSPMEVTIGDETESISLSRSSYSAPASGVSGVSVTVTSNTNWYVSGPSWITISDTSGFGNGSFTFSVTANTKTTNRIGTIFVETLDGNVYSSIRITQAAGSASLESAYFSSAPSLSNSIVTKGEAVSLTGRVNAGDYYLRRIQVSVFTSADHTQGFVYDAVDFAYSEKKTSSDLSNIGLGSIDTGSRTEFSGTVYVVVYVGVYDRTSGENADGGCSNVDSPLELTIQPNTPPVTETVPVVFKQTQQVFSYGDGTWYGPADSKWNEVFSGTTIYVGISEDYATVETASVTSNWPNVPYGKKNGWTVQTYIGKRAENGENSEGSGCSALALTNAVFNGSGYRYFIDPQLLATEVERHPRMRENGIIASSFYSLFTDCQDLLHFRVLKNDNNTVEYSNSEKLSNENWNILTEHLDNGGVGIVHVTGHFMAVVGHRINDTTGEDEYCILDSVPSPKSGNRGTKNNDGSLNLWWTKANLSGAYKPTMTVDRFYLIEVDKGESAPSYTTYPTVSGFSSGEMTCDLGDTFSFSNVKVNGNGRNLKAVQINIHSGDHSNGTAIYRWEGNKSTVDLSSFSFTWGDTLLRHNLATQGDPSINTGLVGTDYWITIYATNIDDKGLLWTPTLSIHLENKNAGPDTTKWRNDYNPNKCNITPEMIQQFLQSYSNGSLWKTSVVNGQVVVNPNYDLHFDWFYNYSNTITETHLHNKASGQLLTPAEIIYYACIENDMNVVLLLAKLQNEQSLIESTSSSYQTRLNRAMGVMKFENGTRSHFEEGEKKCSFIGQVTAGIWEFGKYASQGMTLEQAFEKYTPSSENAGAWSTFQTIYNKYAAWFDAALNTSGTAPVISSVTANNSSVTLGTSITWTAAATGGSGTLQYCYYVFKDGSVIERGSYGTAKTYSYKPTAAGTYTVRVYVKDSGSTVSLDNTGRVTVSAAPPVISGVSVNKTSATVGDTLTWTASASGGSGTLQYCFYVFKNGSVIVRGSYGTAKTYSYKPTTAGTYTVRAYVKDSSGNSVNLDNAGRVTVSAAPPIISGVTVNKSSANLGNTLTWTASASGGSGTLQYCFYVFKDGSVIERGSYGTAKTYSYKPAAAGIYTVRVYVKDGSGTTVTKDKAAPATVSASTASPVISGVTVNKTSANLGDTLTWTAAASGCSGSLRYCFYVFKNGSVIERGSYGTAKTYSYKPAAVGTYTVRVYVKDSSGTAVSLDNAGRVTVSAAPPVISGVTVNKTSASVGSTLTWTAAASGGSGTLQYCFYVFKDGKIAERGSYGTAKTYSYKATAAGTYTVRVYVKDTSGTTVTLDKAGSVTVTG